MGGNNEFFENFERNKYLKTLPSMQRVRWPLKWSNRWMDALFSLIVVNVRVEVKSCTNCFGLGSV